MTSVISPIDVSVGLHSYSWFTCKQTIVRAVKNGFYCLESSLYSFVPSGADSMGHVTPCFPHFYKWLGMGGTVSRKTANKKLTKLY